MEDGKHYDEHEQYGYEEEQEYENEEMQHGQGQYFDGQVYGRYVPQSQQIIHEQPVYYQQMGGHQMHSYERHVPMAHAINPIMPIQYRPQTGPIISIPPLKGNVRVIAPPHVMGPVVQTQLQTFNPVVYHQSAAQVQQVAQYHQYLSRQQVQSQKQQLVERQ